MIKFCGYIKFLTCQCQREQGFQNKLEMYKILYQAYADEIKNLWQRSVFLGAFMTLAWGGYGALQLKTLDKEFEISLSYCLMSIGLCAVIIVLSLLWIAMAKGSKFVQEAHEAHIHKFNAMSALYCDLDKYEKGEYDIYNPNNTQEKKSCCPLKAYRFSPSKINVALGWISFLTAFALLEIHCLMIDEKLWWIPIIFTIIPCLLLCTLKGEPKNDENGGEK